MRTKNVASALALASLALACAASESKPVAAPTTASEQIALGARAYGDHCARCHGDAGQGSKKAPPLVGAGALPLDPRLGQKRSVQFHTALDVAQFAVKNMPPDASDRGEVTPTEYWAIIAFDLSANGVKPQAVVTPENAASFVLHP